MSVQSVGSMCHGLLRWTSGVSRHQGYYCGFAEVGTAGFTVIFFDHSLPYIFASALLDVHEY